MRWDGNEMNRIVRFSRANIKRHKKEAVLLCVLIMLGTALLASSVTSLTGFKKIVPQMADETECYKNLIYVGQEVYSDRYLAFAENDARIKDYSHAGIVYGDSKIKDKSCSGDDRIFDASFISASGERALEKYTIETKLSDEEINSIEHPICVAQSDRAALGAEEGDEVTFILNNKEYIFTLMGFYEPGLWMLGTKAVISDEDFRKLEEHLDRYEIIGFNTVEGTETNEVTRDFKIYIEEESVNDINQSVLTYSYEDITYVNETNMSLLSIIIAIMSGVIIVAVIVMVRFRIVTDISEQIVSIGVLEAIGYKSGEIALSYILEYMIVALAGCILAFAPSILLTEFLLKNAASSIHYFGKIDIQYPVIVLIMIGVLIFVGMVAATKALSVNKYPPVLAFRKGIATHHFTKTYLPLEKTKGNVHVRLALKEFLQNAGKKAGFMVCITVTAIMVLVSFSLGSFFSDEDKLIKSVCGHELADVSLKAVGGTDPISFAEELRSMQDVDKVLLSTTSAGVKVNDSEFNMGLEVYEDFAETETIIVTQGRLPKHNNELAVTTQGHMVNASMGQTVTVEYGKIKRDYIVCGVVNSIVNPNTVYMTEEGFKKINPLYKPDTYKIFLRENADRDNFVNTLTARYGDDIADIKDGEVTGNTYEERIKSAAEIEMAKAIIKSGASYMEYSIRVGDEVITGSTSNMKIESLEYEYDIYKELLEELNQVITIITAVLMGISALVVVIILSILMSSTVRKQYKELGIMKGLGYTSRELKFQMAFRIIPPTIISVIVGSLISIAALSLLDTLVAKITVTVPSVIIVDLGFLLFCFLCTYVSARRIGKISVCELMTE